MAFIWVRCLWLILLCILRLLSEGGFYKYCGQDKICMRLIAITYAPVTKSKHAPNMMHVLI